MNLKKYLPILFILITSMAFSQEIDFEAPNYRTIKSNIEDKNSKFYYSDLLQRLSVNDTLLTGEDYKHIYYGYVYNTNYNPYGETSNEDKIRTFYHREELEKKDYKEFIDLANQSLKEFPIDIRLMNFLAYVHHLNGDEAMAKKVSNNFHGLLGAIMSSGDGLKCETSFHVISVTHEYVILNMFELENVSQSLIGNCDYLAFEKDKYKIPGLYFNVSKLQEKNLEMLKAQ